MLDWSLEPRKSATQHRRIRTTLTIEMPSPHPKYRVRLKDLNLPNLRVVLSHEIGGMSTDCLEGKSLDVCVEFLTEVLQRLSDACSKQNRTVRKRNVPWWSSNLTTEHKNGSGGTLQVPAMQ